MGTRKCSMRKFGTASLLGALKLTCGALKNVGFEGAGEPSRLRSGPLGATGRGAKSAGGPDSVEAGGLRFVARWWCFLCFGPWPSVVDEVCLLPVSFELP